MTEAKALGYVNTRGSEEVSSSDNILIKDEIVSDDDFEGEPSLIGIICYSAEEAYQLYCKYAHAKGFSVRKGKQYFWEGTERFVKSKIYVCNKAGEKVMNRKRKPPKSTRITRRTCCGAYIKFMVSKDGIWEVVAHVKEHNHKLVAPQDAHLLRSARNMAKSKGKAPLCTRNPSCGSGRDSRSMYYNQVARCAYEITNRSRGSMEARAIVLEGLSGIEKGLEAHFSV